MIIDSADTLQPRPSSDEGQRRILDAACTAFANQGFDGASLRQISAAAGVLHTAMLYHFRTKDLLWRAVMDDLFGDLQDRMVEAARSADAANPLDLARRQVATFIRFSAERPQLHRIMTNEARADSPRLDWLVETYTRWMFAAVSDIAAELPLAEALSDPVRLYYAIIGLSTAPFTLAPEFQRLSGLDPFCAAEIDKTVAYVEALILGVGSAEPPPAG